MKIVSYFDDGYADSGYVRSPTPISSRFDPSVTVISQYANSPTLTQLIDCMSQYFDPSTDFDNFYDAVWNIDTASGFGLDIWGKIVNVSRAYTVPADVATFAFSEQGQTAQPFNQYPFYVGSVPTQTYILDDASYRTLILTKALANISGSSAPSINALLRTLFSGRGRCYVTDLGNMSMAFVFEFQLLPYELSILTTSDIIPRPAGVKTVVQQIYGTIFGFAEALGSQPFNQGVFFNPDSGMINIIN